MFDALKLPTDLSTLHNQLDVQYQSPGRIASVFRSVSILLIVVLTHTSQYVPVGVGQLGSPVNLQSPFGQTPHRSSFASPTILRRKRSRGNNGTPVADDARSPPFSFSPTNLMSGSSYPSGVSPPGSQLCFSPSQFLPQHEDGHGGPANIHSPRQFDVQLHTLPHVVHHPEAAHPSAMFDFTPKVSMLIS